MTKPMPGTPSRHLPDAAISADAIVGFPGETDADFQETADFVAGLDISYLHVFTYSERDNTQALEIQTIVPITVRNERNKILRNTSYLKMQAFTDKHIGQTRKVLFEGENKNGMMEGFTDNYIKIIVPYNSALENKIADWVV